MKVYYLEPDMFPGTYNFKDDDNGDFPIGWIDSDGGGSATIVWNGPYVSHRKVIRGTSAGGGSVYRAYNQFTAQADGDIEFYIGSNDCTNTHFFFLTKGNSLADANVATRIYTNGDILYCSHGNGAGGNTHQNMGAIIDNTIAHVRLHFDTATDTISCWRDGTLYVDGENFYKDNVFAADELNTITLLGPNVANAIGYWDAFGFSWDTDYTVGDNLYEKWHVSTQTEVTNIVAYPTITSKSNMYGNCTVILRDSEGALYPTWKDLDFTPMRVEDDAEEIIFKGYLMNKRFSATQLVLDIAGFALALEGKGFNRNYIYAEGHIKAAPSDLDFVQTGYVYADGNGATTDWNWNGPTHWRSVEAIDEYYISVEDANDNDISIFTFGTVTVATNVITIAVQLYGRDIGGAGDITVSLSDDDGATWDWSDTINLTNFPADPTWKTVTFDVSGAPWNQAKLNAMQVKLTAPVLDADDAITIYMIKILVTYDQVHPDAIDLAYDKDDVETDFTWTPDQFITDGRDNAILIENPLRRVSENWKCSALDDAGEFDDETGDHTDTQDYLDHNSYEGHLDPGADWSNVDVEFTIDSDWDAGENPIATTKYLDKIEIHYRYRLSIEIPGVHNSHAILEIWNYTTIEWEFINKLNRKVYSSTTVTADNVGGDASNPTNPYILSKTQYTLSDYLSGDPYATIKLRIRMHKTGDDQAHAYLWVDYLKVEIFYSTDVLGSIIEPIDDNGESWLICNDADWDNAGVSETADSVYGDTFKIGESTYQIIEDIQQEINKIAPDITIIPVSTLSKYIARDYKGTNCLEVLNAICQLEGCHWMEQYDDGDGNPIIKIIRPTDFVDSGVDLTTGGVENWEFEDKCNSIRNVRVFGNAENQIGYIDDGGDPDSLTEIQITDDKINTSDGAITIAEAEIDLRKTKQPSIKLPLYGIYATLKLGTTVDITFVRPAIAKVAYPIRMIVREKWGINDIKTTIYVGLGQTTWDERVGDRIRRNAYLAHKAHTDRLISS